MILNMQAPAPHDGGLGLEVHSVFYTIQGEGPYTGRPAVFVRLYGCNLQCPLCDTDYTSKRTRWIPQLLAFHCAEHLFKAPTNPLIVITGGEPLRQNIMSFIGILQKLNCTVQIETNGTLPLPQHNSADHVNLVNLKVVCAPKTGRVNKKLKPFIWAYKYVLAADSIDATDGLPLTALNHPAKPMLARPHEGFPVNRVYLQPLDPDPEGLNLKACIKSCYEHGYTLCIQQHKIIGVP